MKEPTSENTVEILTRYSTKDAAELGKLLPHLSQKFSDRPLSEELLQTIIGSPFHDQFVARSSEGVIIGAATLSVVIGSGAGLHALLEDFVVNPTIQHSGIGEKLWNEIMRWCERKQVTTLKFTSKPTRISAHKFYLKHGAVIRETSSFSKSINF